ncbi:adenylate kinase 7-like, partial [Clarias magur]
MAEQQKQSARTRRVFVNGIDSYSSKHIAQYLSTCAAAAAGGDSSEDARGAGDRLELVGTVISKEEKSSRSWAVEEYTDLKRTELLDHLMACDVIVYNISEDAEAVDEATWSISALHGEIGHFTSPKMFILVSTLMTWAKTKPADPDSPEIPLKEEDYIRRKPHPNFIEHANAEKLVLKLGKTDKTKLRTYVIGAGMQYGTGEGILHFFFRACWLGELSIIPVPEPGTNIVPTIHVYDLAGIVQNIINHKPKLYYLIAVDDSHHSLEEIVKAIASVLGPEEVQKVPNDSEHLTHELTRAELAHLSINLLIETALVKKKLNVNWVCESGLVNNINHVVEEYRRTRCLLPIKICLLGPPAVGKSSVAARLCKHYRLHHIGVKEAVWEKIKHLKGMLKRSEENHDPEETLDATQKHINILKEVLSQNQGQCEDQNVLHVIREKLHSKPCGNQGFVLDGYPCTHEQANRLFNDEEKEQANTRSHLLPHDEKIIPEYVFSLDASDEFLKERARNLPQSVAEEMRYTQDEFLQRLFLFREANSEEATVLDYFDELEVHPEHIVINSVNDAENEAVIKAIIEVVGGAKNYGPTPEEQEELEREEAAEKQRRLTQEAAERALREAEEETRMTALLEDWDRNKKTLKKQEDELLEARSLPLRHYLMTYVMPTLRDGLVACCQVKPEDPVDFL